jgi:hypothetical protein
MAELVDALVSGTSVGNDVQVRVLFRVQEIPDFDSKIWAKDFERTIIVLPLRLEKNGILKFSMIMPRW